MKCFVVSILMLSLTVFSSRGQESAALQSVSPLQASSRKIELLPSQKVPIQMKEGERNPFARRSPEEENVAEVSDGNSEEDQLRRIFDELPVTGVSRGPRGLRALVGNLILEKGSLVPQMLEDQTEFLVVTSVEENKITLGWINAETDKLTGKELTIGFDLDTKVRSALAGPTNNKDEPAFFERKVEHERRRAALASTLNGSGNNESGKGDEQSSESKEKSTALNGLDNDIYIKGQ